MKIIIFLLLFSVSLFASDKKESDIRKLLELTGSANLGIQMMNQMIANFKQSAPNIPEKFWADFMKEVNTDDLINLIIPIYGKHFTKSDISAMITFYGTPVGKKTIKLMPQIMQESMLAGQQWGKEIGDKVAAKLKKEGYN